MGHVPRSGSGVEMPQSFLGTRSKSIGVEVSGIKIMKYAKHVFSRSWTSPLEGKKWLLIGSLFPLLGFINQPQARLCKEAVVTTRLHPVSND